MRAWTSTGEGTVGLITYMRTDSLRISDEAMAARHASLSQARYGSGTIAPTCPGTTRPRPGAQDAHEAIRPSAPVR